MGGHPSGVYRYVTEVSAGCNESMYPETVTLQNASSSSERTVEGTTLATRSTSPARSSGERTTNSSHRLVHEADDIANYKWFPSAESSIERYVNEITAGMIGMADRSRFQREWSKHEDIHLIFVNQTEKFRGRC